MRRFAPLLVAGVALIAAACTDSVGPTPALSEPATLTVLNGQLAAAKKVRPPSTANVATFSIPAAGGIVRVGEFTLNFPANSVCNPATSRYGKPFWDDPCQTLAYDYPITAKHWLEGGQSYIEFYPDIRFDPTKVVTISANRPALIGKNGIGGYQIFYWEWTPNGKSRVNEGSSDPRARSWFDPATGDVTRQILHFSGLSISSGRACEAVGGEPDCVGEAYGQ